MSSPLMSSPLMSSPVSKSGFEFELEYLPSSPTSPRLAYSSSVSKRPAAEPSYSISEPYPSANPRIIEASQSSLGVTKKENGLMTFYRSLSWMFGFKDKFSLILFFICAGAVMGYCMARAFMMNPKIMVEQTTPGEFRWFDLPVYRINYMIHIYLSIVAGFLIGLQFLPAIRRKSVFLHRVNGYTCIIFLTVASICGGIITRHAFGGEINVQTGYDILAIMYIFSAFMGYWYVKRNTRAHRKWMLRSVVYFSVIISARLIMLASRTIITIIGTYYSLWRCDEVLFVLKNETELLSMFPQCSSPTPHDNGIYVPVHASVHEGPLGTASSVRVVQGMTLWIALIIHMALCETYIRFTETSNYSRHGFVLEHRDYNEKS